mgnify:CR=1 FL=1
MASFESRQKVRLSEAYAEVMEEAVRSGDFEEITPEVVLSGNAEFFRDKKNITTLTWEDHGETTKPPVELVEQLVGKVCGYGMSVTYRNQEWIVVEFDCADLSCGEIIPADVKVSHMAIVRLEDIEVDVDYGGNKL